MGKIDVYDEIMIENQKKREIMEIKEFLHKWNSQLASALEALRDAL